MVETTENARFNVTNCIDNIEMQQVTASVVKAIEHGNTVMNRVKSELSVDYVSDLMSEVEENSEYMREVNEMLGAQGITDEDVLDELAALEEGIMDEDLLKAKSALPADVEISGASAKTDKTAASSAKTAETASSAKSAKTASPAGERRVLAEPIPA